LKHSDRNDLIFFGRFKNVPVCDRKTTVLNEAWRFYTRALCRALESKSVKLFWLQLQLVLDWFANL